MVRRDASTSSEGFQIDSLSVFASRAASGMRGFMAGRTIFGFKSPLNASIESRTGATWSRRWVKCQRSRLSGSAASCLEEQSVSSFQYSVETLRRQALDTEY